MPAVHSLAESCTIFSIVPNCGIAPADLWHSIPIDQAIRFPVINAHKKSFVPDPERERVLTVLERGMVKRHPAWQAEPDARFFQDVARAAV